MLYNIGMDLKASARHFLADTPLRIYIILIKFCLFVSASAFLKHYYIGASGHSLH